MSLQRETLRLDKWLWQARFYKTRSLASRVVGEGRVRLNARRVVKPAHPVGAGDVLTFAQGEQVKVVRILALGSRRGPASEAQTLYEDLSPASEPAPPGTPEPRSGGRPSGKERRSFEYLRRSALE